jgi:redox-sensitive bicupin YhaK (pirin superfamily)
VSPDGEAGSLVIKQDARLYQLLLDANTSAELPVSTRRKYYVHVINGELAIEGEIVKPGDGAKIEDVSSLVMRAQQKSVKALVFDLP